MKHKYLDITRIIALALVVVLLTPFVSPLQDARAQTNYPPEALISTGGITSTHILNGTILNADINASAAIASSKLSFNGTTYTWPASAGTANYVLTTDGVGTLSWSASTPSQVAKSFTAGEDLVAGDPVFIGFAGSNSTTTYYNLDATPCVLDSTNDKCGQSFVVPGDAIALSKFETATEKCGACTGNLIARLYWINGSTPVEVSGAAVTIPISAVGDANATTTFNFDTDVARVIPSQTFMVAFDASGMTDFAGSDIKIRGDGTSPTATGSLWNALNGAAFSADTGSDLVHTAAFTGSTEGRVYQASAASATTTDPYVGVVTATIEEGASGSVAIGGYITGLSGLSVGKKYYLGNEMGTFSLTAGTVNKVIGVSASTTEMVLRSEN